MSDIEIDSDLDTDSDAESSLSDTSDDDLDIIFNQPKVKNSNYLEEIVSNYDNETFFEHFRVSRSTAADIAAQYETSNFYNSCSGQFGKVSAFHQILITLWYMGHQTASFRDVADRFDVTISSIFRILRRVIFSISNLSIHVIKWPSEQEKIINEEYFRSKGFPRAIGVIGNFHIQIDKPKNDPNLYINNEGHYSVQMQIVCDPATKIIDLFVGYPGSVHKSNVFKNSTLSLEIEQKCGNYVLLADSEFPLKKNVMTPFKEGQNLNPKQINYNKKLFKNLNIIEHCFEVLKQKFKQLYHLKLKNITFIVHLIRAACVLHNISIDEGFFFTEYAPIVIENYEVEDDDREDNPAILIRNEITHSILS